MSYDDRDRMSVLVRKEKSASGDRRSDDTQELPPLPRDAFPVFSRQGKVRELPPLASERKDQAADIAHAGSRRQRGFRRILIFAVCFALALFCGFLLSDMFRSHEQALEDSRKETQQIETRQQELAAREESLREQRASMAEQKKALEEKELELERKAQRAAGRTERIEQEKGKSSVVGDWVDKVTGKEKERKEANEKNAAEIQQANLDIASVQQSIRDAQAVLDEVDKQLDNVNEMKEQADRLKTVAQDTYEKNQGTISQIFHYVNEGADMLRQVLR
nr:hypothetical protein [uncultured Selenomonas sp.]